MPKSLNAIVLFLVICAVLVPIWLTEITPLVDLPNHAARVHIISNYETSEFFKEKFEIVYAPIPNMALDLVMVPLTNVIGLWNASRVFLSLTVLLFFLGCYLIGTYDSSSFPYSALFAAFLVYSGTFFYGYLNYVSSVSLFLVTFGVWLRWRGNLTLPRLLFLCILAFGVYLSHLSSIAFLGMAIFIVDIYDYFVPDNNEARSFIRLSKDAVIFIAPAIAFLTFMEGSGSGSVGTLAWSSLGGKVIGILSAFRTYDLWIDVLVIATISAMYFLLGIKRMITIDRRLLVVSIIFFLVYIPAPASIFTATGADIRIIVPAFVILLLSLQIKVDSKHAVAVILIPLTILFLRQAMIANTWIGMEDQFKEQSLALMNIRQNSTIYPILGKGLVENIEKKDRPLLHLLNVEVMRSGSISPILFTIKGQHPLVFRQAMPFTSFDAANKNEWKEHAFLTNYIMTFEVSPEVEEFVSERAALVGSTDKIKIWEVKK